jgi:hypothetical protein
MFDVDSHGTGKPGEAQQRFAPIHEAFWTQLRTAWPSADVERAIGEAVTAYLATLQEPWASPEMGRRAADAYAECARRMRDAGAGGVAERVREMYRRYLQDLKDTWTQVDPGTLAPQDLGALAQGMSWVAGVVFELDAARSAPAAPGSQS